MGTWKRSLSIALLALVAVFGVQTTATADESQPPVLYEGESLSEWVPAPQALSIPRAFQSGEPVLLAEAEGSSPATEVGGDESPGLEISVTNDWVSKYMFRGYDILDDSGAWQPSVDFGLWDTGLHLNWWASYASHDRGKDLDYHLDRHDLDEHDYAVYWEGNIAEKVDVELGYIYYDFIHLDSRSDFMEWYGVFTLSSLPLSPYFGAYYGHEKHDDTLGEGWNTTLGVSQSVPLGGLTLCGSDPLSLDLAADVWYNGGQYYADTGWSHATFGGSVTVPLPGKLELTPGVWYQVSMEDDINTEDEWWATLSLAYSW